MKILLSAFLITLSITAQAGLPPTTLSGQSSTVKPTTFTFKAPYNQATQISGVESLIETGNENMLVDAGMESSGVAAWTCTVGTCSKTSTSGEFSSGKQALKVVLSAQSMNVSQTVNTPSGIQKQGYFRILYRIPATGIVTPTMTITVDSVLQTTVPSTSLIMDGTFRQIEVPLIFGSTNVKVSLLSGSSTGTVFFDAAIVSQGLGTQNLMLDNVYSAELSGSCAVTFENKDWILSTTNPSTGQCNIIFVSNLVNQQMNCATTTRAALSAIMTNIASPSSTGFSTYSQNTSTGAAAATTFGVICQKSGNDYLASSANVYSSTNGNTNPALYTPIVTGLGSITTEGVYYELNGSWLHVYGTILTGTVDASVISFSLPSGYTIDATKLSTVNVATNRAGFGTRLRSGGSFATVGDGPHPLFTDTATSSNLIYYSVANSLTSFNKATGSSAFGNNERVRLDFSVPVSGRSNSNVIVGSFEKIEKCANDYECADTFSAQVSSTGVVSNENLNWINGNCTNPSAGNYTCTFNTTLKDGTNSLSSAMNCKGSTASSSATYFAIGSSTTSSVSIVIRNNVDAGAADSFSFLCQKGSQDYKPKTAKVASSIGVPTVPGITTEAIDTFSVSYGTTNATTNCTVSPCSYLDQIGSAVSSITRSSTGVYSLNTLKTYTNLKCTGVARSSTGAFENFLGGSCVASSSCAFSTGVSDLGTTRDTNGTLMCQGSY